MTTYACVVQYVYGSYTNCEETFSNSNEITTTCWGESLRTVFPELITYDYSRR